MTMQGCMKYMNTPKVGIMELNDQFKCAMFCDNTLTKNYF